MKRVIQTAVVGVLLAAAQSAFAFPAAAETNVGQGAFSTSAEQHERAGTLLVGSGSPFPISGEESVGQPARDTYADAHARKGDMVGSNDSPYPISADVDMRKWDVGSKTRA
jgi:type IV secretory pathway TrbL component